jgi:hypothetical protein
MLPAIVPGGQTLSDTKPGLSHKDKGGREQVGNIYGKPVLISKDAM